MYNFIYLIINCTLVNNIYIYIYIYIYINITIFDYIPKL